MNHRASIVLLVTAALLAAVPVTEAARGRRPRLARGPTGTFHGVIAAVAGNTVRLNVGKETEKIVIFWTDQHTSITGGGKNGTIGDLEAGQTVTAKANNGKATSIEVEVKGAAEKNGKKKTQPAAAG